MMLTMCEYYFLEASTKLFLIVCLPWSGRSSLIDMSLRGLLMKRGNWHLNKENYTTGPWRPEITLIAKQLLIIAESLKKLSKD